MNKPQSINTNHLTR